MPEINTIEQLMQEALLLATHSPDPSTQNGALLCTIDPVLKVIARGINEFPSHVKYLDDRWERPIKYSFIEHAERNVIYNAAKQGVQTKNTIMICPWAACADCARAIIQTGIIELVTLPRDMNGSTSSRWKTSCQIGDQMMKEAGVEITFLKNFRANVKLKRNGSVREF